MEDNKKAIFFDRDGVINEAIWRDAKPRSPRDLQEWVWNEGIHETITTLKSAGFLIFVVTNQPDVHRKQLRQEILNSFHQKIYKELNIDDLAVCMHDDEHHCHCRKPKPGMLIDLAKKWHVSLLNSFVIGDTVRDMQAGKAAGCSTILLDKHYNQNVTCDFRAKNLSEVLGYLLGLR